MFTIVAGDQLRSLDPLCHLAATTTGGMPHDEEGVRRGAIVGGGLDNDDHNNLYSAW